MDKDKLIIVIYVNIAPIDSAYVSELLFKIAKATMFDESIVRLVIPVREGETRVECINPQLITEDKYKEVEETIEKLKEKLKDENLLG
jgi:hypothetical protein